MTEAHSAIIYVQFVNENWWHHGRLLTTSTFSQLSVIMKTKFFWLLNSGPDFRCSPEMDIRWPVYFRAMINECLVGRLVLIEEFVVMENNYRRP